MVMAAWTERVARLYAQCVFVCVFGGLGELVQWRNSIGISDNTQVREGGRGLLTTQPIQWEGEMDTLNLTDTQRHTTTISLPALNLSFSLPLPLHSHGQCSQFNTADTEIYVHWKDHLLIPRSMQTNLCSALKENAALKAIWLSGKSQRSKPSTYPLP